MAVAGFFVLAAVGWSCDVPLFVCGLRALAGAAILYVMTSVAGKIVLGIAVDAMLRSRNAREASREHGSK